MLVGAGRHQRNGNRFSVRSNLDPTPSTGGRRGAIAGRTEFMEKAYGATPSGSNSGVPSNTVIKSFAKPTSVGLQIGLVSDAPHQVVTLAREMYSNDGLLGAVVDTLSDIPFGAFSLSGIPKELMKPYEVSLDRVRAKTLMPSMSRSHLVDGAFLGSGLFDDNGKVWDAIIPQDLLHATITPVPFFGATPIIDIQIQQEVLRNLRSGDERMQRYLKFMPEDMLHGGVIKLQPENTFYVPRKTLAHVPIGVSIYRKIMIVYLLEKALARGTIEMAHRRQRPMTHIMTGDENWDPSVQDMKDVADLFMAADLDPLGAFVVTRPGVVPQEMGGMNDMVKWTDVVDVLSAMKLKGMAMPDGLLGGDMALDSVSATLTVFINMTRQLRDYITRLFYYEKFFPYIAVTNGHRKDRYKFEETSSRRFQSRASDSEVDMEDYVTPVIQYHNTMRPEGDNEYLTLLMTLSQQFQVPIPIRIAAAAGGFDVDDLLNSSKDDLALRTKLAAYQAEVVGIQQAAGGGQQDQEQQGGGGGFEGGHIAERMMPIKHKGIIGRTYDDRLAMRATSNNHKHYTTARERKRLEEKANRVIAEAAANVARKENWKTRQMATPTGIVF